MSLNIWNSDWLNQNANRAFPVHEDCTGMDISGTFALPREFIVDLLWPIHTSLGQECDRFHLYSVVASGDTVTINVAYTNKADITAVIGSATINRNSHKMNMTYLLQGVGEFKDSVGFITIGRLDTVYSQGGGYRFDLAGAALVPTCIRPNLRGVSSLRVQSGNDLSDLMTGDVELLEGWNVRLTVEPGNKIRIDARSDANMREDCECDDARTCIKTINGVPPDASGNFTLVGDQCLTLNPITNGLQFIDECSSSCCGCDELTVVIDATEEMSGQIDKVEMANERIQSALNNMVANILASKTNAQGC